MSEEVDKKPFRNPYIPEPEDYFEGYNESIKANFNPKELVFQEAAHRVLGNLQGKEFLEMLKVYVNTIFIDLSANNSHFYLISQQGMRLLINNIEQLIETHEQHINQNSFA